MARTDVPSCTYRCRVDAPANVSVVRTWKEEELKESLRALSRSVAHGGGPASMWKVDDTTYQLTGPQHRSRTDTLKVERTFLECYITECIRLDLFDAHESKLAEVLTAMCLR